jgi:D-alanine transaminase
MPKPERAYVNGEIVPIGDAKISVLDRGFLFGDGIYEVTAVLDGHLVDGPAHLARLERSLGEIGLASPVPLEELPQLMRNLIQAEALEEGLVYLQITRGSDVHRAFPFPDPQEVPSSLILFVMEKNLRTDPVGENGMRAITVPEIRWARRDIKSISLLAQVLCKQAAVAAGVGEALMVEDGYITEGTTSAACMVTQEGALVSRPVSHAILNSVTRRATFRLADELNVPIEERLFTPEEAYTAREVFCTSASNLIHGLIEIDGHRIGNGTPGPLTRRLREIYLEVAASGTPEFQEGQVD